MLNDLIGSGPELTVLQMGTRAFFIFIIALILIRLAGIRAFGMKSAFDNIIILLLGAILSRAVYSSDSVPGILLACLVIVLMHRVFAILCVYSDWFGKLVKGDRTLLLRNGKSIPENMRSSLISHKDLDEGLRMAGHTEQHHNIEAAYLERNGHISVIRKASPGAD
ncbi:MAG: DUF421 domain-containing protein [Bacteroidota bacterium]|nr:DUF421 domain-containing protein [Bacteroidota bacterium]MDP4230906.1 DUF421 domain-containing protein [Bacteroidota bacterium]MDP4235978.1 DUF421 domain-containing protein [Bacteroidota bacterium]